MKKLIMYTDGASRGNPGDAGIGIQLQDVHGEVIQEIGEYLGVATNNVAEYKALIRGLEETLRLGYGEVDVYTDSELLVKQIKGDYRVKNQGLKPLYNRVLELRRSFNRVLITHVPREKNTAADRLANEGINQALRKR